MLLEYREEFPTMYTLPSDYSQAVRPSVLQSGKKTTWLSAVVIHLLKILFLGMEKKKGLNEAGHLSLSPFLVSHPRLEKDAQSFKEEQCEEMDVGTSAAP